MEEHTSMREAWNERARRDAFLYVETAHWDGDVEAFFALGEERCRLLVDPILDGLPRPARSLRALDLGCGVGRITRALASRFASVTGIDVSDEMVARAAELHPPARYPNVSFVAADGLTLPLDDADVGFAFSYEVVQHMPSRRVIAANLREVARVLEPDGRVLVHVHTAPSRLGAVRGNLVRRLPPRLFGALRTRVLGRDALTGDATFRGSPPLLPGEIVPLFAEAGLHVLEVRDDPTHPPGSRALVVAARA